MRFRSIGISASNIRDYLNRIKELEDDYINESTLAHLGFISLEEKKGKDGLLGPNSLYKLKQLKSRRRRKKRKILNYQYCRKKLYFYHPEKNDSNDNSTIDNDNNK